MTLTVVTGPPAAGKTTHVLAHARPGDIVIDYDLIAQALTIPGASTHDHGRLLRGVAYRARTAAIHEALRVADRIDVWLIHAHPDQAAMARYTQAGAHVVTIDPGYDVVMARVREQRPTPVVRAAERWYRSTGHHGDVVAGQGSRHW